LKGKAKMRRSWVMIAVVGLVVGVIDAGSVRAAEMPGGDTYTNSVGMKFARIEPGTFRMGVGDTPLPDDLTNHRGTQREGDFDERPNHTVKISSRKMMMRQ
jgi:formylglycine-generating enzyme required for sulfatase activity